MLLILRYKSSQNHYYTCTFDRIFETPNMYAHKNWNSFYYISHTQALSRHGNNTADNKVCFFWWLFNNPVKPWNNKTDSVGPLRGINKMHEMGCKLLQISATACGMVKGHYGCFSGLQLGQVFLPRIWTHLPTSSTLPTPYTWHLWYSRQCKKTISKTSKPISSYEY